MHVLEKAMNYDEIKNLGIFDVSIVEAFNEKNELEVYLKAKQRFYVQENWPMETEHCIVLTDIDKAFDTLKKDASEVIADPDKHIADDKKNDGRHKNNIRIKSRDYSIKMQYSKANKLLADKWAKEIKEKNPGTDTFVRVTYYANKEYSVILIIFDITDELFLQCEWLNEIVVTGGHDA